MKRILSLVLLLAIGTSLFESRRIVSQDDQCAPIKKEAQTATATHDKKEVIQDPLWDMINNSSNYSPAIQQTINSLFAICKARDFDRVKSVKELDFCGLPVRDLTPLAYLTNLEALDLDSKGIEDITPLASLTKLKRLVLSNNKIKDINVLDKLPNLEYLLIYNNTILDIMPLSKLTNLKNLSIFGNHLKHLTPLIQLTTLKELNASHNLIEDVSPLAKLIHLEKLDLDDNRIEDTTPLASCNELEELSLSDNKISDVRPLMSLVNLSSLSLSNNHITDVRPLVKLTNLESLYLSDNHIKDAMPLTKLKKLRFLFLANNQITKTKSLDRMKGIEFIDLECNPLEDGEEFSITKSNEIDDQEKHAHDLAESRELTSSKGKAIFDRGMGGMANKDLCKPLPAGMTHDDLIKLLAGTIKKDNEALTFDQTIACAWPARPKLYIGIGTVQDKDCYKDSRKGIQISAVVFSIKEPHDFEIIAQTQKPINLEYMERKESGQLAPHGAFNQLVSFEESIYKIAPDEYAFGLRLANSQGYAGGFAHFENLILFALKDKTIVPVLNHPIYSLENYADKWNGDGTRQHSVTEIEWEFTFARKKRNNYFDIDLETKQKIAGSRKRSHLVWKDDQYVVA